MIPHVVALGNFDGVHLGHMEILKNCYHIARLNNYISSIITFYPHPNKILYPNKQFKYLLQDREKIKYIVKNNIHRIYLWNFTKELSLLEPDNFLKQIVSLLNIKYIITGEDFKFGRNAKGDVNFLCDNASRYGYKYRMVNRIMYDYHTISSSYIKYMLSLGAVGMVKKLLGRPYKISGPISKGIGLASTKLKIPTINIKINDDNLALPAYGSYLVKIKIADSNYYGVSNIGVKPSVNIINDKAPTLETHIFNFNKEIHQGLIDIEFIMFLRPERKLSDLESLRQQINRDIKNAKYILKNQRGNRSDKII